MTQGARGLMRDISVFALTRSSDQTSDSIHESLSIFRLPSNTFRSTRCTAPPNYFGPLISDDFKNTRLGTIFASRHLILPHHVGASDT